MARVQSQSIRVRVTPQIREAILAYAERNGIENRRGTPNVSAALRTLLELMSSDGSQEAIYRIAYANARSDVIQSLTARFGRLVEELVKL